jgi:hypothetical protein
LRRISKEGLTLSGEWRYLQLPDLGSEKRVWKTRNLGVISIVKLC